VFIATLYRWGRLTSLSRSRYGRRLISRMRFQPRLNCAPLNISLQTKTVRWSVDNSARDWESHETDKKKRLPLMDIFSPEKTTTVESAVLRKHTDTAVVQSRQTTSTLPVSPKKRGRGLHWVLTKRKGSAKDGGKDRLIKKYIPSSLYFHY